MSMRVFIYPAQRFSTMATRLRNMMMPVRFLNGIKAKSVAGLAMPTTSFRPF